MCYRYPLQKCINLIFSFRNCVSYAGNCLTIPFCFSQVYLGKFLHHFFFFLSTSHAVTNPYRRSAAQGKRDVSFVCFSLIFSSSFRPPTPSFQVRDGTHRQGVKGSRGGVGGTESCFVSQSLWSSVCGSGSESLLPWFLVSV